MMVVGIGLMVIKIVNIAVMIMAGTAVTTQFKGIAFAHICTIASAPILTVVTSEEPAIRQIKPHHYIIDTMIMRFGLAIEKIRIIKFPIVISVIGTAKGKICNTDQNYHKTEGRGKFSQTAAPLEFVRLGFLYAADCSHLWVCLNEVNPFIPDPHHSLKMQ
jgi:hypothetical protein